MPPNLEAEANVFFAGQAKLATNARRLVEDAALAEVATHVVSRLMPGHSPEVSRVLGMGFGGLLRQWLTPRAPGA